MLVSTNTPSLLKKMFRDPPKHLFQEASRMELSFPSYFRMCAGWMFGIQNQDRGVSPSQLIHPFRYFFFATSANFADPNRGRCGGLHTFESDRAVLDPCPNGLNDG